MIVYFEIVYVMAILDMCSQEVPFFKLVPFRPQALVKYKKHRVRHFFKRFQNPLKIFLKIFEDFF